jgi:hypothetical protein
MATAAEVAAERGPSAGCLSDPPFRHGRGSDTAFAKVGGHPTPSGLTHVKLLGLQQKSLDPGVRLRSRARRQLAHCIVRQVPVEVTGDFRGGDGDPVTCGQDGGTGLGARIAACPGLRAGGFVLDLDAMADAGDVGAPGMAPDLRDTNEQDYRSPPRCVPASGRKRVPRPGQLRGTRRSSSALTASPTSMDAL